MFEAEFLTVRVGAGNYPRQDCAYSCSATRLVMTACVTLSGLENSTDQAEFSFFLARCVLSVLCLVAFLYCRDC